MQRNRREIIVQWISGELTAGIDVIGVCRLSQVDCLSKTLLPTTCLVCLSTHAHAFSNMNHGSNIGWNPKSLASAWPFC